MSRRKTTRSNRRIVLIHNGSGEQLEREQNFISVILLD